MRYSFSTLVLCLSLCFLSFSCAQEDGKLRGSIEQRFSLAFDKVEVINFPGLGMQILYTAEIPNSNQRAKIFDLFVDTSGPATIGEGIPIDLVNNTLLSRFNLVENQAGDLVDDGLDFPAIDSGLLEFQTFSLLEGDQVTGTIDIVFFNGDTLLADFDVPLTLGEATSAPSTP